MEIRLKDYQGNYHTVELPEGTKEVVGIILSSDEVLISPVYCDPMRLRRELDFFDGTFCRVFENGKWQDKNIPRVKAIE